MGAGVGGGVQNVVDKVRWVLPLGVLSSPISERAELLPDI